MSRPIWPLLTVLVYFFITHQASAANATNLGDQLPSTVAGAQDHESEQTGESLPLYEMGVGIGVTDVPDYPGADHDNLYALPIPFFIYRGDLLRSDKEGGTRARWPLGEGTEFYVSAGGNLPSSSASDHARAGMPNLDLLGEVGPAVSFRMYRSMRGQQLKLNLPVRAVGSFNFRSAAWRGLTFNPTLIWDQPNFPTKDLDLFAALTLGMASQAYNSYFYSVPSQYATWDRRAYQARGGYVESSLLVGSSYKIDSWNAQVFGFVSYDTLANATNQDSPLLKKQYEWSEGLLIAWEFLVSDKKVGH